MTLPRHILRLLLPLMVISLSGCRPNGILHSWEMRDVLIDLHKTDAMLQLSGMGYGNEDAKAVYYAQVLERHGITQAVFDSSLVWYTAHPRLFDKIYPKVLAELKAEEEIFVAMHEDELNLKPGSNGIRPLEGRKKKTAFTAEQLDSVLRVMQHGHPNIWFENPKPLVHDTVDKFFPQVGVLGGGVVDSLQTGVSLP